MIADTIERSEADQVCRWCVIWMANYEKSMAVPSRELVSVVISSRKCNGCPETWNGR